MSHTERRAAATTAAIEGAALALAMEHGLEHVTVDRICEAVGISQRTFFNHFPTKDDALLGSEMPGVDEHEARRFIIATGPLLLDAIALIRFPVLDAGSPTIEDRMRVIASSPGLLARQMERIGAIESELREIIALRLEHQRPETTTAERAREAAMTTHLLAGFIRFVGSAAGSGTADFDAILDDARAALTRVLLDSRAPAASTPTESEPG